MIQPARYLSSVLETDLAQDTLLAAKEVNNVTIEAGELVFTTRLIRKIPLPGRLYFDQDEPATEELYFRVRFYQDGLLRLLISREPQRFIDDSPMLQWDPLLKAQPADLKVVSGGWVARGEAGAYFLIQSALFAPNFSPDGRVKLEFNAHDQFEPAVLDSLPAFLLQRDDGQHSLGFSLHIPPGENFCGAGERFERPNLFGQRIDLINYDARGVNNPRAYKNIPFLLSSRGYGLFVHSPAKMRLDVGAHSTRALQWLVEDDVLDLFIIGGGNLRKVLHMYGRITGFPTLPPAWSFGLWMSRSSYYSDAEVSEVARRLRTEGYPADVLHLDTGWFRKEWVCDWKFSEASFPDPRIFSAEWTSWAFR
jgi:alpha-D-xyloside xylohydrolase